MMKVYMTWDRTYVQFLGVIFLIELEFHLINLWLTFNANVDYADY